MPEYLVEHMKEDTVMAVRVATASTPIQAAMGTARRQVTFRDKQAFWIRVTAAGRPPFEYVYTDQSE